MLTLPEDKCASVPVKGGASDSLHNSLLVDPVELSITVNNILVVTDTGGCAGGRHGEEVVPDGGRRGGLVRTPHALIVEVTPSYVEQS